VGLQVDIEKRAGDFYLRTAFSCGEEFMGLLGASGCGKSMTLKCIAGIEKPDRGRIVLDGRVLFDSDQKVNLPPQKRRVGYLFQNYALFPNMTVWQNILCGLHAEKNAEKKKSEAERMIGMMELTQAADLLPGQLSGGQAQRAALARILVSRPQLLMLDEPFSALDSFLRLRLQMELKELLRDYGHGIVMVTHDRDEAFRMCDRIGVMHDGRVLAIEKTKQLFADPGTKEAAVLTGCKNIAKAEKAGEREVFVPDWNIHLTTRSPVRDDLCAVGIRAHYFHPTVGRNCFPVRIVREMEEPFAWVSEFRYEAQTPESPALWWRYPKDKRAAGIPEKLGVSPADILLLYPCKDEDRTTGREK